jgi:hypothetical protein
VVTRGGFSDVVDNAFASLGFSPEAAKHAYPTKMFIPGGDLAPIDANLEAIVSGLTSWQPKAAKKTMVVPEPLAVAGADYPDAMAKFNALFLRNLWSDGLPLLPPTEERVKHLLRGTDLPRSEVLGRMLPRGALCTVESVAVAAAMAGCRPEYMPVLLAAVEAILDPAIYHQHMNSTTGNAHPAVVVNGAVAVQIRVNSGYGCLAPSSVYPAGASIGRAIRLLLMNVGGGIPGTGSMAIHGGPGRYTGLVFAEDEAGLPGDWAPLNTERGFDRGANSVTVLATSGTTEVWDGAALHEQEAMFTLFDFAGSMSVPYGGYFANTYNPKGAPGIVLMARNTAQGFAGLGWSKAKIRQWLWEHSMLPDTPWLRDQLAQWSRRTLPVKDYVRYPMPVCVAPENIMIVVAGGEQSGHSYWLQVHGGTHGPASRGIRLPKGWQDLLDEAEQELGPVPASS